MFLNNLNNLNNLNINIENDGRYYLKLIRNQNEYIIKLNETIKDRKNLTKGMIDQAGEDINKIKKESLEYYNKYKQALFDYTKALKQLNDAGNVYRQEMRMLNL